MRNFDKIIKAILIGAGGIMLAACSPAGEQAADEEAMAASDGAAESAEPADQQDDSKAVFVKLQTGDPAADAADDPVLALENVRFSTGITGHFLVADVKYGGNCRPHDFTAYWTSGWMKSNPPQVNIVLRHNANGDDCKSIGESVIHIDLADLVKSEPNFLAHLNATPNFKGSAEVSLK